jgi:hypothetical protein
METVTWVTVISRDAGSLSENNVVDDFMTTVFSHEMSFLLSFVFNDVDVEYFIPSNGDLNYGEIRATWTPERLNAWINDTGTQTIRETYEMDILNFAKNATNINITRYVAVEDILNDPNRRMIEDFVESTIPMTIYQPQFLL